MTASMSSAVLGTVTLTAGHDPEAAWPDIRDLGCAGGLAPLPAARLAFAVTTLAGLRGGPAMVEIAGVDEPGGRRVKATIHGGPMDSAAASPGLAETSRPPVTAAGTVTWILTVKVTDDAMTGDPAWVALDLSAAGGDSRELLVAVLAAAARDASRAEGLGREVLALRRELDESSQGLQALHSELSDRRDELTLARAAAEQATRDKADFLARMSHEIRSPMNAVTGFTSLLRATQLSAEQTEYVETAEAAGAHLLGVINGILDSSKIEAGLLELEPGAGPAAETPAAEAPAAGAPAAGSPTAADQAARRVLYVDDNRLLTVLVERIFAADPTVTMQTAPDGRTALELAFQQQPDMIMLDLHLADMSGEALLRQFRADPRTQSVPAVIVSGDADPATIERLTALGAIAYVTKPFTALQLRDLVSQVSGPGHGP